MVEDVAIVSALQQRGPDGMAAAYDTYAQKLYGYAANMLRDQEAAADVVHDSFLIAGERIDQLRDPSRLRPWLYAIVRSECLRVLRARKRQGDLPDENTMIDETTDLDKNLRETDLAGLVAAAAAGLGDKDREVLDLALRHDLDGGELAAALGVSQNHAHALLSRARQQLERSLLVLVVIRTGRDECGALDGLLTQFPGELTPLWRKRIGRHIDNCAACGGTQKREFRASALLATLPIVAVPFGLREAVLRDAGDPNLAPYRQELAQRAGPTDRAGFPKQPTSSNKTRAIAGGAAAALIIGGAVTAGVAASDSGSDPDPGSPPNAELVLPGGSAENGPGNAQRLAPNGDDDEPGRPGSGKPGNTPAASTSAPATSASGETSASSSSASAPVSAPPTNPLPPKKPPFDPCSIKICGDDPPVLDPGDPTTPPVIIY